MSAEIAYSAVDPRWSFPYYWYNFTETCPDGATVEFVFIDTVLLVGMPETEEGEVLAGDALPGPPCAGAAKAQWDYIEKTLAASTADYLIVAGYGQNQLLLYWFFLFYFLTPLHPCVWRRHYPVWSIAEHGPTSQLVEQLRPLLIKAKASAYFCGHDVRRVAWVLFLVLFRVSRSCRRSMPQHAAEHIDDGTGVQYHVIGASHGVDDSTAHMDSVPSGSLKFHFPSSSAESFNGGVGAFATVSASKTGLVVTHYRGDDGSVLYTAPTIAPRTGLRE